MVQAVKFNSSILFEIETINGVKFIKKADKEATKRAGKTIYVLKPPDEIINSDKPVIYPK